jgi:PIN like domain
LNFFFDNCMSPHLAEALNCLSHETSLGYSITHLRDKFPLRTTDPVWLRALGAEAGWVVLTGDSRISTTPHLKVEWLRSGLTAFFFQDWWSKLNRWHQASHLFKIWPDIVATSRNLPRGTGLQVNRRLPFTFVR